MQNKIDYNNLKINARTYTKNDSDNRQALDLRKALMLPRILYINVCIEQVDVLKLNYQLINTIGNYTITNNGNNQFTIDFINELPIEGSTNMGVQLQNINTGFPKELGLMEYHNNQVLLNVINTADNSPSATGLVYEAFIKIELYDTAISVAY